MPSTALRRPLPALIFLVALTLLTALVWWRVLSRGSSGEPKASGCSSSAAPVQARSLPAPASVSVWVRNATDRSGVAKTATDALRRDGFRIGHDPDNDAASHNKIAGVAEIRYTSGHAAAARLLSYYFPHARTLRVAGVDDTVIVSLGKAYRRVAAETAVQAQLTAAKITLTETPTTPAPTPSASC